MKTIGLIGGMSWESSANYYRMINELIRDRMGPLHSSKSIMFSVNFSEIEALQKQGQWDEAASILVDAALRLESVGAECIVLCTNTMHKIADKMIEALKVPLIHIADSTASKVVEQGLVQVGLLGTLYTMEEAFYKIRIESQFGLKVLVPAKVDREIVHRIIYDELCQGKILDSSRQKYKEIAQNLISKGAKGIILGCTEISLLINQVDFSVPVFDTTAIYAQAAVDFSLN